MVRMYISMANYGRWGFREDGHRVLYFSSILGCITSGSRLEVSGYIRLRYLAAVTTGA